MSSRHRWSSLAQLGLDTKANRKHAKALVAAGRIVDLGKWRRKSVYTAVTAGSGEELKVAMATLAASELVQPGKLTLLPVTASGKSKVFSNLPSKVRGAAMLKALQQLAKRREAFLVRVGNSTFAVLAQNCRALLDDAPVATPAARGSEDASRIQTIDRASVLLAYRHLSRTQKSPNIPISDLIRETAAPRESFKEWLLAECREHRAIPFLGEPTHATEEQLDAALPVDGRPHIYIQLMEEEQPR